MKLRYKNQDLRGKQLYHLFITLPLYKFNYTSGIIQAAKKNLHFIINFKAETMSQLLQK